MLTPIDMETKAGIALQTTVFVKFCHAKMFDSLVRSKMFIAEER